MIETATGLSWKLNVEISEIREKQRSVVCQKRKLIEEILGEFAVPRYQSRQQRRRTRRNPTLGRQPRQ